MASSNPKTPREPPPPAPHLRLVFWESTTECNLACAHCRRIETGRSMARWNLSTSEVMAVLDDLGRTHPKSVFVFSGGEPLLRDDLFTLAGRARAAGLLTALATNGTLLTPELADRVAAAGFSRTSVSLDGARADTHAALRGDAGSFEAALQGLRLLRRAGQAVQINMSVTRRNAGELGEMFTLAEAEGVEALHIFVVVPVGCGAELGEAERLSPREYEALLQEFCRRSREAPFDTKATCAPQYARVTRQVMAQGGPGDSAPTGAAPPAGGCLAGSGVCFISHRGDVFPCGYLPVRCGNVREMPLSEIWGTSPVFIRLRQPNLLKGKCGACDYRHVCCGCRARAFAATGDYMAAEPDCLHGPHSSKS
jgi:radical SAM protein with 4Fe4S-binding SPASM domain